MKYEKLSLLLLGVLIVASCNFSGVDKEKDESFRENGKSVESQDSTEKITSEVITPEIEKAPIDTLFLNNGIYIVYNEKGSGEQVKDNDVIWIDYTCRLTDGKVFDTNKKLGKPIPYMVGWGLQTEGWDIAVKELKEGDEVDIFLPAKYARGEKGIPGVIPPNADNVITLKVNEVSAPDYTVDGVEVWVINRGKTQPEVKEGDEILIDYFAHAKSNPRYDNSFKNGEPYQLKVGGGSNLPGLNMALSKAQLSDKLWVRIPARHAFGTKGNLNLVKPNESVFFDLRILKILDAN